LKSTTKIETEETIESKTSNVWNPLGIGPKRYTNSRPKKRNALLRVLTLFDPWRKSGIDPRRVNNGTANKASSNGKTENLNRAFANDVVVGISLKTESQNSVLRNVVRQQGETKAPTMWKGFAAYVGRFFKSISTPRPKPVHVVAVQKCDGQTPVYDLTVRDDHHFFANGILVSNCDGVRYVIYAVDGKFYFSQSELTA